MTFQFVLQLEFFSGFFNNIFNIIMALIFVLVGMLVAIVLMRYIIRPKNQILYCRERDGRGHELNVSEEDHISLETATDPALRFFKYGRAYEFIRRGRSYTRFFGKEGTAYTWVLQGFHKIATHFKDVTEEEEVLDETGKLTKKTKTSQVPDVWEEKKVELTFPSLEEAVKYRWGKENYETLEESWKNKLRDDKVLLTVNLEPGITPEGYVAITEQTINAKGDEDAASLIGKELKESTKTSWVQLLVTLVAGMGIAFMLLMIFGKIG